MNKKRPLSQIDFVRSAWVIDKSTGQREKLERKDGSPCHFFKIFADGSFDIQLRLDWSDLDENGFPTLDADFYDIRSGKKSGLTKARRNMHHTKSSARDQRIYLQDFFEASLAIQIEVHYQLTLSDAISISASITGIELLTAKGTK